MKTVIHLKRFFSAVIILPVIIFFELSLSSCTREPSVVPPSEGLVSFYDFQNKAADLINNNDGIENNVKYLTVNFHSGNIALLLNGKDSYLRITDPFDYEEKTISLCFYVVEAFSNLSVIYSSDNPGLKYGLTLLNVQSTGNDISLYFNVSNNQDTVMIMAGKWYHAAFATKGREYFYYLNGTLTKSGNINQYISSELGVQSALLGCDRYMNKRFFHGMIDNLRIYNRKLSDAEIRELYQEIP